MTLADIIRATVPHRVRITVGIWVINQASRTWATLQLYMGLLHGKFPKNMGIEDRYCYYNHDGKRVRAPRNAAGVFMEIFQDEVYEQVWEPGEGDTVLDIGAYVGMFAVKAAGKVGLSGRVIAIEPCPDNYRLLDWNCEGLANVTLVQKAVMAENGIGKLYYSRSPAANSLVTPWKKYVEVETITLDRLLTDLQIDKVDFVKLDAEGAELAVLSGAARLLAQGTRLVIAAYHTAPNGKAELSQLTELLEKAGYTVQQKRGLRSYLHAEKQVGV